MKDASKFIVLLDNGHGNNTIGKRSPDGRLLEYAYTREITAMIKEQLSYFGIQVEILVPEQYDVKLEDRVKRCNNFVEKNGSDNCIFISVHNNAAGKGGWMNARGWSGFVYRNARANSIILANLLHDAAVALGIKTRKPLPKQKFWECGFYVCKHTNCPAVLTENLFQDNKEDVEFLLSDDGKQKIAQLHVDAILEYYKQKYGKSPEIIKEHKCNLK